MEAWPDILDSRVRRLLRGTYVGKRGSLQPLAQSLIDSHR
jgi:hypothetical protein